MRLIANYHHRMASTAKGMHLGIWLAVFAVPGLVGCTSRARSFCDSKIQCEGGNDADVEACVIGVESSEDVAAAYDCGSAFDKAADCVETAGRCDAGKYKSSCDAEDDALEACIKAASDRR